MFEFNKYKDGILFSVLLVVFVRHLLVFCFLGGGCLIFLSGNAANAICPLFIHYTLLVFLCSFHVLYENRVYMAKVGYRFECHNTKAKSHLYMNRVKCIVFSNNSGGKMRSVKDILSMYCALCCIVYRKKSLLWG